MGLTKHYNKIPFRELEDEALESNGTGGFLTKPSPLMNKGKWLHGYTDIVYNESTQDYIVTHYNPTDAQGQTISGCICTGSVSEGYHLALTHASGYLFGEVRCTIESTENPTAGVGMQGNTAWRLTTSNTQQYISVASSATSLLRGHTQVHYWCYLIPQYGLTAEEVTE